MNNSGYKRICVLRNPRLDWDYSKFLNTLDQLILYKNFQEDSISLPADGFFTDSLEKNKLLTDTEIGATIEYLRFTTKKILTPGEVVERWEGFKIRQFSLHEWYNSWEKLLNHFRDSLKLEVKNGTHQQSVGTS